MTAGRSIIKKCCCLLLMISSLKRNIVSILFFLYSLGTASLGRCGRVCGTTPPPSPSKHSRQVRHTWGNIALSFLSFQFIFGQNVSKYFISNPKFANVEVLSVIIKSSFRHNGPQGLFVWGAHNEEAPSSKVIIVLIVVGDVALLDWWHNFLALLENMKNTDFFAILKNNSIISK